MVGRMSLFRNWKSDKVEENNVGVVNVSAFFGVLQYMELLYHQRSDFGDIWAMDNMLSSPARVCVDSHPTVCV